MANPSDMTDEELKNVIETGVEPEEPESTEEPKEETPEATPEEPTPEAEKPEEPEVTPSDKEEQNEEPEKEPEETPPSRREILRVSQLLAKYGDPTGKSPEPSQKRTDGIDYNTALDADPEVIKQLETDRQVVSDRAYLEGLRQSEVKEWKRDLKFEAPIVEEKFPFLNPRDTEHFKPAAAEAMNQKYLRFIGYDAGDQATGKAESIRYPDVSYREFIEAEMEFVDELASQKVAESTKNIVKQAAATGLRPDGSSAKRLNLNQSEKDMTLEELYAAIGQKPPKN